MPPRPEASWKNEKWLVADRIAKKAESFSSEATLKYNSLSSAEKSKLFQEFKAFIAELNLTSLQDKSWSFVLDISDGFHYGKYEGRVLRIILFSSNQNCYAPVYRLEGIFLEEGESWIKLAVSLEDGLEKIIEKFEELYQKQLAALRPDAALYMSLDFYHLLKHAEKLQGQRDKLLSWTRKTVSFLNTTKGIFKSKAIKEFRMLLEAVIKSTETSK